MDLAVEMEWSPVEASDESALERPVEDHVVIAQRAVRAAPFYAMAFEQQAVAIEARGEHVVRFNLGEPDFGAPSAVREAMRTVMDGRPLAYTPALGTTALRSAIATFYGERHGVRVDPARVVVTSGASSALLLALASIVDVGSDVIMADPSYPCNRQLVESFGGRVVPVETTVATRFQLNWDLVQSAWTDDTRAVMIASPSNPTGTSVDIDEMATICAGARSRGAWRVVDEIYLNLADHDVDGNSPRSVLSVDPDAIVINSFSKYFGMTGWRLGWCIVPERLVSPLERLAMNYFLCASSPAQQAALACFEPATLSECEDRRAEFVARRGIVLDELTRIGLPVPVEPDGAFYVYVDVSGTGLDAWEFCERALREAHVAITPGRDFSTHTADTHVRLSYATSRDELREGLARLGTFVAELTSWSNE